MEWIYNSIKMYMKIWGRKNLHVCFHVWYKAIIEPLSKYSGCHVCIRHPMHRCYFKSLSFAARGLWESGFRTRSAGTLLQNNNVPQSLLALNSLAYFCDVSSTTFSSKQFCFVSGKRFSGKCLVASSSVDATSSVIF